MKWAWKSLILLEFNTLGIKIYCSMINARKQFSFLKENYNNLKNISIVDSPYMLEE